MYLPQNGGTYETGRQKLVILRPVMPCGKGVATCRAAFPTRHPVWNILKPFSARFPFAVRRKTLVAYQSVGPKVRHA